MAFRTQLENLWANLAALGKRKLSLLAAIGLAVFLTVGGGAYYLSRPSLETLYTGLSREDVGRMGSVLHDHNIPFDVSADGSSLLVGYGNTAQARMLLAEKGLPQSTKSGYELFNDLGSLGLTSFMQEMTKIRALEGELARTIQSMKGVKSARVHIVLGDRSSFRHDQQSPSASVVIRTEPIDDTSSGQAIRHLVSAAIPGLKADRVTVMNTEGTLLASGEDTSFAANGALAKLEKGVSSDIQASVRRTLAPYLGINNFELSVAARLNTDKVQTTQTTFDPESRVERSVRSVKESENSQNRQGERPTTVQQNLPNQNVEAQGNDSTNSESQKREDTTNYEVSSKTIQTVSDGYSIKHLAVAVLVNRARLLALAGENATPAQIDSKISEIEQLVVSASGLSTDRGDQIKVAAVSFANAADAMPPVPAPTLAEIATRQLGTLINAAAVLIVCGLVIYFGLRPATKMLLARNAGELEQSTGLAAISPPADAALDIHSAASDGHMGLTTSSQLALPNINEAESPQRKLDYLVSQNEDKAAAILRRWMMQEAA